MPMLKRLLEEAAVDVGRPEQSPARGQRIPKVNDFGDALEV